MDFKGLFGVWPQALFLLALAFAWVQLGPVSGRRGLPTAVSGDIGNDMPSIGSFKNAGNFSHKLSETGLAEDKPVPASNLQTSSDPRFVFLLFGPPGAGKGTQGELLEEEFTFPGIATGDLFRGMPDKKVPMVKLVNGERVALTLSAGNIMKSENPKNVWAKQCKDTKDEDDKILCFFKKGIGVGIEMEHLDPELEIPLEIPQEIPDWMPLTIPDDCKGRANIQMTVGDCMKTGIKVPGIANQLVEARLDASKKSNADLKNGFYLDGFPRGGDQAKWLIDHLQKKDEQIMLVIDLTMNPGGLDADEKIPYTDKITKTTFQIQKRYEALYARITGRWIHKPSGRSYHVDFRPPKSMMRDPDGNPIKESMLDDETRGQLVQRKDDTVEGLTKRLEEYDKYRAEVMAVLEEDPSTKDTIKHIDATQDKGVVTKEVMDAVEEALDKTSNINDIKEGVREAKKARDKLRKAAKGDPLEMLKAVLQEAAERIKELEAIQSDDNNDEVSAITSLLQSKSREAGEVVDAPWATLDDYDEHVDNDDIMTKMDPDSVPKNILPASTQSTISPHDQ